MNRCSLETLVGIAFILFWVVIAVCCFSRIPSLLDDRCHPLASPLYSLKIVIVVLLGTCALCCAGLGELEFIFPDETWRLVPMYAYHILVLHILRPAATVLFCIVISTPAVVQVSCCATSCGDAKHELPSSQKRHISNAAKTPLNVEDNFHASYSHREVSYEGDDKKNDLTQSLVTRLSASGDGMGATLSYRAPMITLSDIHLAHSTTTTASTNEGGGGSGIYGANRLQSAYLQDLTTEESDKRNGACPLAIDSVKSMIAVDVPCRKMHCDADGDTVTPKNKVAGDCNIFRRGGCCFGCFGALFHWIIGRPLVDGANAGCTEDALVERWSCHLLWRVSFRLRLLAPIWLLSLSVGTLCVLHATREGVQSCQERISEMAVCRVHAVSTSKARLYLPRSLYVPALVNNALLLVLWAVCGVECLSRLGNVSTKYSFLQTYLTGALLLMLHIIYECLQLFEEVRYNGLITVVMLSLKNVSEGAFVMLLAMRLGSGSRRMPWWYTVLRGIVACRGNAPSAPKLHGGRPNIAP